MKTLSLIFFTIILCVNTKLQAQSWAPDDVIIDVQNFTGIVSCHGGTGYIKAHITGGQPPFILTWYDITTNSNGVLLSDTIDELDSVPPGSYELRIGKSGSTSWLAYDAELDEPDTLIVLLHPHVTDGGLNISQYGGNDGSITSEVQGGSPTYTYLWSNSSTSSSLSNLIAGTYSLTVSDYWGCVVTHSVSLTEPAGPLRVVSISSPVKNGGYNVSCQSCEDGKINLTVAGGTPPYRYRWSNGNMSKDVDTLARPIQYTVQISDSNRVSITQSITLHAPTTDLSVSLSPTNLSCYNCNNGSITATASGGVSPYRYLWSNSQTTATISGLASGTYSVIVTDTNGVKTKTEIYLKEPAPDDWLLGGNASVPSSQFIGTTDTSSLVIKTNSTERIRVKNDGNILFKGVAKFDSIVVTKPIKLDTIKVNRIMPEDGDSIVRIGYSSIDFSANSNNIFVTATDQGKKGIGIGNWCYGYGLYSGAFGYAAHAWGDSSFAFGHLVNVTGNNSMIIGSGYGSTYLVNSIANSIMFGSNTLVPALTILGGNSTTSGNVGIGGSSPQAKLQIDHNDSKGGIILNRTSSSTGHSEIKFFQNGTQSTNLKWAIGNDLSENNTNNFFIWNHTRYLAGSNGTAFYIDGNNNVGIDLTQPSAKLDVNGNINAVKSGANSIVCGSNDAAAVNIFCKNSLFGYGLGVDASGNGHVYGNFNSPTSIMTFTNDGAVGINFDPSAISNRDANYRLYVDGSIAATEIKVTATGNFPDYVFKKDYKLISIRDLKKYIENNNHLPGIPSSKEISENNGIEVGTMQTKLLEKLEEHTLYIVSLQEQIDELKNEIKDLKK